MINVDTVITNLQGTEPVTLSGEILMFSRYAPYPTNNSFIPPQCTHEHRSVNPTLRNPRTVPQPGRLTRGAYALVDRH